MTDRAGSISDDACVLRAIRRQSRLGDPVPTGVIKDAVRGVVSYDGVDRALKRLLARGVVRRPTRGFWLPVEDIHA
jgi:RIO-like serine/threonine protein kinase